MTNLIRWHDDDAAPAPGCGFAAPEQPARRSLAVTELLASAALAASTIAAMTAVSIGYARAGELGGGQDGVSILALTAVLLVSLGGLLEDCAALTFGRPRARPEQAFRR